MPDNTRQLYALDQRQKQSLITPQADMESEMEYLETVWIPYLERNLRLAYTRLLKLKKIQAAVKVVRQA